MACLERSNVFDLFDAQYGGSLAHFSGVSPYETHLTSSARGHGLSSLFKTYVMPVVKEVGKNLAKTGIDMAKNVAEDMIKAKSIKAGKSSLKKQWNAKKSDIKKTALSSLMDGIKKVQKGSGSSRISKNKNNSSKNKKKTKQCKQSVAKMFKNYFER